MLTSELGDRCRQTKLALGLDIIFNFQFERTGERWSRRPLPERYLQSTMTQLPSSEMLDPSPSPEHNPQSPKIHINDESEPSPEIRRAQATRKPRNAVKRPSLCALWCRAGLLTILVVFAAYVWLSWTDPDQVEMRKMAWDSAMEKIKGKQVIHAQRFGILPSAQYYCIC